MNTFKVPKKTLANSAQQESYGCFKLHKMRRAIWQRNASLSLLYNYSGVFRTFNQLFHERYEHFSRDKIKSTMLRDLQIVPFGDPGPFWWILVPETAGRETRPFLIQTGYLLMGSKRLAEKPVPFGDPDPFWWILGPATAGRETRPFLDPNWS